MSTVTRLHPRDTFDVHRQPLGKPSVIVSEIGQGEMDHLVNQHPVVFQFVIGDVAPYLDTNDTTVVTEHLAGSHAAAFFGHHMQP